MEILIPIYAAILLASLALNIGYNMKSERTKRLICLYKNQAEHFRKIIFIQRKTIQSQQKTIKELKKRPEGGTMNLDENIQR